LSLLVNGSICQRLTA